jgi:short-subunit dehydrogenase
MSAPTTGRPLAVVAGASSGIGYELARQFAEHGFDLLIAAEDVGIERAGADLRRDGGPEVQICQVQAVAGKVMPDTAKAEMHRRMAEPGSGQ